MNSFCDTTLSISAFFVECIQRYENTSFLLKVSALETDLEYFLFTKKVSTYIYKFSFIMNLDLFKNINAKYKI